MNRIDWAFAATHAVWLLGLGVVLAVGSYADWRANMRRVPCRALLTTPMYLSPLCAGLALFCVGMALVSRMDWQTVAWGAVGLILAGQSLWYWRVHRRKQV